jgi:hypothetical protein
VGCVHPVSAGRRRVDATAARGSSSLTAAFKENALGSHGMAWHGMEMVRKELEGVVKAAHTLMDVLKAPWSVSWYFVLRHGCPPSPRTHPCSAYTPCHVL